MANTYWCANTNDELVSHLDQGAHQWRSESQHKLRMDGCIDWQYGRHRLVLSVRQSTSRLWSDRAGTLHLFDRTLGPQRFYLLVARRRKFAVREYHELLSPQPSS